MGEGLRVESVWQDGNETLKMGRSEKEKVWKNGVSDVIESSMGCANPVRE